jgi:anaerobic magnesium-protoporphyrin IX monomethyl ester cyclase
MAVKRPGEFFRSVWDLGKYYIDIMMDQTNSSESWMFKMFKKMGWVGNREAKKLDAPKGVTRGGEVM